VVLKYTLLNEAESNVHGLTGAMVMSEEETAKLALFEGRQIRKAFHEGEWWIVITDILAKEGDKLTPSKEVAK
jgi:hypothetical protein